MLFIFRLEGNRGGGNNFDRVASTFSPRRGSGDDDFSFFLTRRVLFYFISFFFFVSGKRNAFLARFMASLTSPPARMYPRGCTWNWLLNRVGEPSSFPDYSFLRFFFVRCNSISFLRLRVFVRGGDAIWQFIFIFICDYFTWEKFRYFISWFLNFVEIVFWKIDVFIRKNVWQIKILKSFI